MMNFRGIFEVALGAHRFDDTIDKDAVSSIREELKAAEYSFPTQCPWIGTDAWIMRFIERTDVAKDEPEMRNEHNEVVEKPTAAQRIMHCLKWREDNGVNDIIENADEDMKRLESCWPIEFHGTDKRGFPVLYERLALMSPKPVMKRYTQETLKKFVVYNRELLAKKLFEKDSSKSKYCFVESCEGLGWAHAYKPLLEIIDYIVYIDEWFYPHSVYRYWVIEAPWLLSFFKTLLRVFVYAETLNKVTVHTSYYLDDMKNEIDENQIPKQYGGTCDLHHERCLKHYDSEAMLSHEGSETAKQETEEVYDDAPLKFERARIFEVYTLLMIHKYRPDCGLSKIPTSCIKKICAYI